MGCGGSKSVEADLPRHPPAALAPSRSPTSIDHSVASSPRSTDRLSIRTGPQDGGITLKRVGSSSNLGLAGHHPHARTLPELPSAITLAASFNDVAYFKSILTLLEAKLAKEARLAAANAASSSEPPVRAASSRQISDPKQSSQHGGGHHPRIREIVRGGGGGSDAAAAAASLHHEPVNSSPAVLIAGSPASAFAVVGEKAGEIREGSGNGNGIGTSPGTAAAAAAVAAPTAPPVAAAAAAYGSTPVSASASSMSSTASLVDAVGGDIILAAEVATSRPSPSGSLGGVPMYTPHAEAPPSAAAAALAGMASTVPAGSSGTASSSSRGAGNSSSSSSDGSFVVGTPTADATSAGGSGGAFETSGPLASSPPPPPNGGVIQPTGPNPQSPSSGVIQLPSNSSEGVASSSNLLLLPAPSPSPPPQHAATPSSEGGGGGGTVFILGAPPAPTGKNNPVSIAGKVDAPVAAAAAVKGGAPLTLPAAVADAGTSMAKGAGGGVNGSVLGRSVTTGSSLHLIHVPQQHHHDSGHPSPVTPGGSASLSVRTLASYVDKRVHGDCVLQVGVRV